MSLNAITTADTIRPMGRWEAGAGGRLAQAAYELWAERGYDDVTVAEIAARAGLTKRTFFRYFPDKREVLFMGAADFQAAVVTAVIDAPDTVAPLDAVATALATVGSRLTARGEPTRQRQQLIAASTELREREMIKMAELTAAIGDAVRQRGVGDPTAGLTAQAGVAVFTTAFDRWATNKTPVELTTLVDEALHDLRIAVCPAATTGRRRPPA